MPYGKTHDRITLIVLPIVVLTAYLIFNSFYLTLILSISYLFSALMFNGDLDTNSKPYNRWFILKMIWIPYQLMFGHRSIFTHGIIIGTVIRIIYIGIIPFLYFYYYHNINILTDVISIKDLIVILIGLELGSLSHSVPDWLT